MANNGNFASKSGVDIGFNVHGRQVADDARRLLLLHSIGLAGSVWRRTIEHLTQFEVLTVDIRGHGRSGMGDEPFTVELLADDVAHVMDVAGWDRAIIVGASMGGMIAQALAARHPHRAVGLGLVDTTAWYGLDGADRWEERARKVEQDGLTSVVDFQTARWFSPGFISSSPHVVRTTLEVFLGTAPASFAAACRMMATADLRQSNPTTAIPCVVIVGSDDYATPPAMAVALADSLPRAILHVLPGVRHLSFIESPADVASLLAALSERIDAGRRTRG